MKQKLIEKIFLRVIVTILVGTIVTVVLWLSLPTWEEDEISRTTVTLYNYRMEKVGAVPRRNGSSDIAALIYTASDGEEYQIAMFHKKEGKELKGKTVEIRYAENASSYAGAHMIVELTVDGEAAYTLADYNEFQENRRAVFFWCWFGVSILPNLALILDVLEYFGIVKRRRRYRKNREAHKAQIQNLGNRPRNFPNTVWTTEDGSLTLTVLPDGTVTGTIRLQNGETVTSIPVLFDDTAHTTIRMAEVRAGKPRTPYIEIWEATYHSPDEFEAMPQKTTYFKKGKTVTLRRTDGERE